MTELIHICIARPEWVNAVQAWWTKLNWPSVWWEIIRMVMNMSWTWWRPWPIFGHMHCRHNEIHAWQGVWTMSVVWINDVGRIYFLTLQVPVLYKCRTLGVGVFKNMNKLINLRALTFSLLNKNGLFQCMGKIFSVEFQRSPLKFHTKYLTILWQMCSLLISPNSWAPRFTSCFWNDPPERECWYDWVKAWP